MFLYLAAIAAVSYVGYVIVSCVLNYRKLSHIDGPFLAKIGPFWLMYHTLRGDLYQVLGPSMKKYGVPMRIAPNFVAHDDPDVCLFCLRLCRTQLMLARSYDKFTLRDRPF